MREKLERLHEILADRLLERIQEEDCPPGVISAAVKFLKDNDITALVQVDSPSAELFEKLAGYVEDKERL